MIIVDIVCVPRYEVVVVEDVLEVDVREVLVVVRLIVDDVVVELLFVVVPGHTSTAVPNVFLPSCRSQVSLEAITGFSEERTTGKIGRTCMLHAVPSSALELLASHWMCL